jgi:hypothetical protein
MDLAKNVVDIGYSVSIIQIIKNSNIISLD